MSMSVCLHVGLSVLSMSVREHISGTTGSVFANFEHVYGRGSVSSGGAAIRYVLPVYK